MGMTWRFLVSASRGQGAGGGRVEEGVGIHGEKVRSIDPEEKMKAPSASLLVVTLLEQEGILRQRAGTLGWVNPDKCLARGHCRRWDLDPESTASAAESWPRHPCVAHGLGPELPAPPPSPSPLLISIPPGPSPPSCGYYFDEGLHVPSTVLGGFDALVHPDWGSVRRVLVLVPVYW